MLFEALVMPQQITRKSSGRIRERVLVTHEDDVERDQRLWIA
jgi:hypothetical protein